MPTNEMMGRWANMVEISIDPHAFTLDFFRMDQPRRTTILVARVTLSALTANALADGLEKGLAEYASRLVEAGLDPLAVDKDEGDNDPHEHPDSP